MPYIIGSIGGMGPQATINLYQQIVSLTLASVDQEHIHVIIDSYPQIPDRTRALQNKGEDPLPYLLESAMRLETAGVDCLVIPCNTAHAFVKKLQDIITVPILNMIEETAKYIKLHYPESTKVGFSPLQELLKPNSIRRLCRNFNLPV